MAKSGAKKSSFLKAAQKGEIQNNNGGKTGAITSKANFTMKSNPARKKG